MSAESAPSSDAIFLSDAGALPQASQGPVQACWQQLPTPLAAVLVLSEVFGVNGWVRSVSERLAAHGYAALALPIFSRTAPDLDVGYSAAGLAEGRRHRDQLTAAQFLDDARAPIAWLQAQPGLEQRPVGCAGFCFGGHLALLAATCDFCGAWVSTDRPGGGLPTLAELPQIGGTLQCFCGDHDPLMPPEELVAIRTALAQAGQPPLIVAEGAGHGFMCEARADFNPEAAAQGWQRMLALFAEMP